MLQLIAALLGRKPLADRLRSEDQLRATWDRDLWHVQSRVLAAGASRRLRIDAAGAVYPDIVGDHDKADRALGGFVDGAADRHTRMRHIDQTGNVPRWIITRIGEIYARGQRRVLINRYAGKRPGGGSLNIEHAARAA